MFQHRFNKTRKRHRRRIFCVFWGSSNRSMVHIAKVTFYHLGDFPIILIGTHPFAVIVQTAEEGVFTLLGLTGHGIEENVCGFRATAIIADHHLHIAHQVLAVEAAQAHGPVTEHFFKAALLAACHSIVNVRAGHEYVFHVIPVFGIQILRIELDLIFNCYLIQQVLQLFQHEFIH